MPDLTRFEYSQSRRANLAEPSATLRAFLNVCAWACVHASLIHHWPPASSINSIGRPYSSLFNTKRRQAHSPALRQALSIGSLFALQIQLNGGEARTKSKILAAKTNSKRRSGCALSHPATAHTTSPPKNSPLHHFSQPPETYQPPAPLPIWSYQSIPAAARETIPGLRIVSPIFQLPSATLVPFRVP